MRHFGSSRLDRTALGGHSQALAAMDQTEKAFQKQDAVFIGAKRLLGKKASKKALRYWRNVGLGFSTPKEAKEGNFVDKKRHTNLAAHCSPAFDVKEGDILTVGQCRPLCKTVRFNVLKVEKNQIFGTARKQFRLF